MTKRLRVVMLDPDWFGDIETERAHFERLFDDVVVEAVDCTDGGIPEAVGEADVLLSHYTGVSAESMDATGCSVIARYATGVDGIDIEAATRRGIRVTRVTDYCDDEVGTHAVSLALALVRGLPIYDAATENASWEWADATPIRPLSELTFGLLAFGHKARSTARKATALGFDLRSYDPYVDDATIEAQGVRPVGFGELLDCSDVLSIHTPLTEETEGMVDAAAIDRLGDDAMIVNTARGRVIDETALLDALEDGRLRGAGLDVLAHEPPDETDPLLGREDVIVTPHAAWYSTRTARTLRRRGTQIAVAAYEGEAVDGLVNPGVLDRDG